MGDPRPDWRLMRLLKGLQLITIAWPSIWRLG
jgi:hypothetical protein